MDTKADVLKTCKKCGETKDENEFYVAAWDKTKRRATCISCHNQYYKENFSTIKVKRKNYRETNKEYIQSYRQTDQYKSSAAKSNKKRTLNGKSKNNLKQRKKTDIIFRVRTNISTKISRMLRSNGRHKHVSFLKCVPYTLEEFQQHLESQFEPWMTWDNYGKYHISTWNDNDLSTWTWNIDHIIPQSDLPYASMTDDNFQKCWALENLRPLSAKQNLKDGAQKIRHNKL